MKIKYYTFIVLSSILLCGCVKTNSTFNGFICGRDKVTDADGNMYKTAFFDVDGEHDVTKNGQCWMAENLNAGEKILDLEDSPSDESIIEKWCQTDEKIPDECYPFIHHFGGETASDRPEYCPKEQEKIVSPRICDRIGGTYSAYEIMRNKENICPAGWEVPTTDDWEILKSNIQAGLGKDYLKEFRPGWELRDDYRSLIPVGEILKNEAFNGLNNEEYETHFIALKNDYAYSYSLYKFSSVPGLSNELVKSDRPYKNTQEDAGGLKIKVRCIKKSQKI